MGLRILWMSNTPWCSSGYGVQSKYLMPRFKALGHEPGIFAFYGLQGGILNWQGFTMYPLARDPYGNDVVEAHYKHFKADLLITLVDVWVLEDFPNKVKRWVPYMPVDHQPIQRIVLDHIKDAWKVIPYAKFGEVELRKAGVQNVSYIPHGVDVDVFKPLDDRNKYKRMLGFDETDFVVIMVQANKGNAPSRKNFDGQLRAFAQFAKRHPDAKLYMHTEPTSIWQGVNLPEMISNLSKWADLPDLAERIHFCDRYENILGYPPEYMARAYNAADVCLMATMGEGFGIPTIESQACGTPVIGTDATSTPELITAGYRVRIAEPFYTPLASYQFIPDTNDILNGLEWAYTRRADTALRAAATRGMQQYSWDNVVESFWKPWLAQCEAEIRAEEPQLHQGVDVPRPPIMEATSATAEIVQPPPVPAGYKAVLTEKGYVIEHA